MNFDRRPTQSDDENARGGQESPSRPFPFPSRNDASVSGLAERTCARLWDEIGRMESGDAATELAPSPFRSYEISREPSRKAETPSEPKRFVPKYPSFKRASSKTTPFVLKRVSVLGQHETPSVLPETVSAADPLMPFVVSPVSVRLPSPPRVISPRTVSAGAEQAYTEPVYAEPELPRIVSPRVVRVPRPAPTRRAESLPPAAAAPEVSASAAAAVPHKSVSLENIPLKEIHREFARSRAHSEKTRRRRFRSPLINGEIREELKDEYYWEILSDDGTPGTGKNGAGPADDPLKNLEPRRVFNSDGSSSEIGRRAPEPTLLSAIFIEPVIFIGHITILAFSPLKRGLGRDNGGETLTRKSRRASETNVQKKLHVWFFDILIALICGIAIAALGIFPLLKMFGTEIYRSIRLSGVRRLNEVVSVSEDPTMIQAIIEQPEILSAVEESLISGNTGQDGPGSMVQTSPWQEEAPEFDSADWSGALLNEFEGPEAESNGRGQ